MARHLLAAAAVACALGLPGLAWAGGGHAPHVLIGDFGPGPAPGSLVDALAAADARRDPRRPHVEVTSADRARARRLLAAAARLERR